MDVGGSSVLQNLVVVVEHLQSLLMNEPVNIAEILDTSSVCDGRSNSKKAPEEFSNITIFATQYMAVLNTVKIILLSLDTTFKMDGNRKMKMTSVQILLIIAKKFNIDLHAFVGSSVTKLPLQGKNGEEEVQDNIISNR